MNNTFCQAPWSHAFINNDGKVYPCVFSVEGESFGDINQNTLDQIWQLGFKQLRQQFSDNKPLTACNFCIKNERNKNKSMRTMVNNQPLQHWENGPRFIGIKFSNVCNLKCRICSPEFSSAWGEEKGQNDHRIKHLSENFLEKIIPGLGNTDFFHFTGGEPLLSTQHLNLLNWLKQNKPNATLTYNTNLTQLEFGRINFIQEWKSFKKVYINFSIDAWGDKAEYLRTGTKWSDIEKNIEQLKSTSNVEIIYYITLYAQNIIHLPDLINNIRNKFQANASQFFLNYLVRPSNYHISSVLPRYRPSIIDNIEALQKKLFIDQGACALSLITQLTSVINILKESYCAGQWEKTIDHILKNQPAGMNFFDYFSEFK